MIKINWLVILEWAATIILLIGVGLTSFNVYPWNIVIAGTGNFLWLLLSYYWNKPSLLLVQAVILLLYIVGLTKYFFP